MTNSESQSFFNKIKNSIQASLPIVTFSDWQGCYALFSIYIRELANGEDIRKIFVAREGDWTDDEYANYDDIQSRLGKNLIFQRKEYVRLLNRTLIEYSIDSQSAILAIPATGEEISCEIYGQGATGALYLLDEREL